jgi:hypothetical protein
LVSFTFEGVKFFLIMGIAELALGILLFVGILKGRRTGVVGRLVGGLILIVFGVVFLGIKNAGEIEIGEGRMHLKVPLQRDKVVRTEDIIGVREVHIGRESELRPVKKVFGGTLGDVRTGWFKLANGEKAFLALEGAQALYVETSLGFPVLVGADDFDSLKAAFYRDVYNR